MGTSTEPRHRGNLRWAVLFLAVVLVGLGVHTLSMSPRGLAAVAAVLRSVDLATAQALAEVAIEQPSAEEVAAAVRTELSVLAELGL